MSAGNPPPEQELPRARPRKRRWTLSFIWVVPVLAALVAGYLIYQRVRAYGPTISIQFQNVDGIMPGQTHLQYRGADVGEVSAVALGADQQAATVEVKLRRFASAMARAGSVFWIVRPQLGMGTLSGLGTIITGPYIDAQPGQGKPATEFVGLENSPEIIDPNGLEVVLLAAQAGSLRAGVPVYYRGVEVGSVRKTGLGTNAAVVVIHCVIRQRFAPLVRMESKFWNVTGLDVHLGLFKGAEVTVESLKSLLVGGIAFATPEDASEKPVPPRTVFRLYDAPQKEWEAWEPRITLAAEEPGEAAAAARQGTPTSEVEMPGAQTR